MLSSVWCWPSPITKRFTKRYTRTKRCAKTKNMHHADHPAEQVGDHLNPEVEEQKRYPAEQVEDHRVHQVEVQARMPFAKAPNEPAGSGTDIPLRLRVQKETEWVLKPMPSYIYIHIYIIYDICMYCMVVSRISFPALQKSPWDVTRRLRSAWAVRRWS
jgi:hypothetical protein